MRITVLCTDLGIQVPGAKGASMHLQSITSAFVDEGHDVQLIGVAGDGAPPEGLGELHLLPHPHRTTGVRRELDRLAFVDRVATELRDSVQAFAPHLVYERLSLFGTAGMRLRRYAPRARHLVEVNALVAEEQARWRGLHLHSTGTESEHRVLSAADLAVAVSAEVADDVRRVAPTTPCAVVENGAEVERFTTMPDRATARAALALPTSARIAVFVGALRPWHGVDLAIAAIASTADLHLAVVGDGPVRSDLAATAHDLGVSDRVHFLGQRPHRDVVVALAAADVAVAPYPHLDGFAFSPLKLYEYLASGRPVVASAIGQIPAALGHGRFGTLVTPGDVGQLAHALSAAVTDDDAARRAAAGRAHALAHHGWRDRAARIVELAEVRRAVA